MADSRDLGLQSDEATLRRLQDDWMQAWVDQDRDTLERILAPQFMLVPSSMADRPVTRDQWLGMLERYTAEGFSYRSMLVRLFGEFAVVSSIGQPQGARIDGADRSLAFFLVDVWQKRDGDWQVISRYSSMPEPPSPSVEALKR